MVFWDTQAALGSFKANPPFPDIKYSASYLISCRDSGKPTETNLDVHNYLMKLSAQPLNKGDYIFGNQKIGPPLYSTEGLAITKKNVDW